MIKLRKRLGSTFLALMMLLSLLPATAFAAGGDKVAAIGTTEYETLQEALNAADNGDTVKLLKDVKLTSALPGTKISGKTLTIDGAGKKISFNPDNTLGAVFGNNTNPLYAGTNLTVENLTIENTKTDTAGYATLTGYLGNGEITVAYEKCTFINLYTAVYVNPVTDKDSKVTLNLTNCTYTDTPTAYAVDVTTAGAYQNRVEANLTGSKGYTNKTGTVENCVYIGDKSYGNNLSAAVADAQNGDTILLTPGEYTGPLNITKRVNLIGAGADKTTINGPIQYKFSANQGGKTVTVEGLTVKAPAGNSVQGLQFCGNGPNAGYNLNIRVKNCAFEGWTYGVSVNSHANGYNMTVSDCDFTKSLCAVNFNYDESTNGQIAKNELTFAGNNNIAKNGFAVEEYNNSGVPTVKTYKTIQNFVDKKPTITGTAGTVKYVKNTTELNDAIAAAQSGTTIVLAPGTYNGVVQVNFRDKQNITIQGAGMNETTLVGKDGYLLNLASGNCSGLTVKDLSLKAGEKTTTLMKVASATTCSNLTVKNVAFVGGVHGIYLSKENTDTPDSTANSISITGCKFSGIGGTAQKANGIYFQRGQNVLIDNCRFENITATEEAAAVNIAPRKGGTSQGWTIINNVFDGIQGTQKIAAALAIHPMNGAAVKDVTITGNKFSNNKLVDILMKSESGAENWISNLLIANNGNPTISTIDDGRVCRVTFDLNGGNGTYPSVTLSKGDSYTLPTAAPSRPGYTFQGWYANGTLYKAGDPVTISKNTTFTAQWRDNTPYYGINVLPADNGTVTCYARSAAKGATVTVKVKAAGGYHLDKLVVTDAKGNVIDVKQESYGTYTFVMPASTVTVEGVFLKNTPETLPFSDVKPTDWFYNAVKYVYANDLMNGVEGGKFAPNATLDRAMMVTILYRLDGQPAVSGDVSFGDVPAGTWYTNAVKWAADNGIVKGVEGNRFAPTDGLTREQMATILYRYAQYKKLDVSASADLTAFVDGAKTSAWAADAMEWAVGAGLINGLEGNTLAPQGTSTRAQVAAVLMRFCENIVK